MRVYLGECGVDSGQIMLIDPCYVLDRTADRTEYFEVCGSHKVGCDCSKHEPGAWHDGVGGGIRQGGVVVGSFGGDGVFPVYAQVVDGQVQSVTIEFNSPEYDY